MKKWLFLAAFIGVLIACNKEDSPQEPNPFAINNVGNSGNADSLDPTSFAALHKDIFATKCAVPLCHDGTFEPDFRTIESAYNTLVYHPVVKNNPQNSFVYRVIPKDPTNSWLMERLISIDPVLGRMPLYADSLNEKELNRIKAWINDGCKDISGKPASFPNLPPQILNRFALNANQVRIDTSFSGRFPAPFIVAQGSVFTLVVQVKDDSTLTSKLKNLEFKFSYDRDNFSQASSKAGIYFIQDFIIVSVNTTDFQINKPIYFRFYCRDDHQIGVTEYPKIDTPFYLKEVFAFIVR